MRLESSLVAERCHTTNQCPGVGYRSQVSVTAQHPNLSKPEAACAGLRRTASSLGDTIGAKYCGRPGACLLNDREGVSALSATTEYTVDQVHALKLGEGIGENAVPGRCLIGRLGAEQGAQGRLCRAFVGGST